MSSIKVSLVVCAFFMGIVLIPMTQSKIMIAANEETATPSPYPTSFPAPLGLEILFACPNEIVVGEGPNWQGIVVGKSDMSELNIFLADNFDPETDIEIINETSVSQFLSYGDGFLICMQDNIVVTIWAGRELSSLSDLIAVYGVPDTVTWAPTYNSRVAFWFEHGMAAEILTATTDMTDPSWGFVSGIFYFPYQDVEGFEERWPYNATKPEMPSLRGIGDVVPTEQNPFDFDAMIATITAEPSCTPTPTFTPRPTEPTATATP